MNSNTTINRRSWVIRSSDCVEADVDGEVVAMDIEKGNFYGMGLVGSDIWNLISEEIVVEDVVKNLIAIYDIDENRCMIETVRFLEQLQRDGLMRVI